MPAPLRTSYALSMPLYRAEPLPNRSFGIRGEIHGTCFSIGGNYMMTAGHVITSLVSNDGSVGIVALCDPGGSRFKAAPIALTELLPHDIGVLELDFVDDESKTWFHRLKWNNQPLVGFDPVRCCGYAYGQHKVGDRQSVVQRCFQGHVVAPLNEFELRGANTDIFSAYELSFPAPRGLSGSPLLNAAGTVMVNGVVIGNSDSQMCVFRSKEIDTEAGKDTKTTTIVERYESLSLGIAVQPNAILLLPSSMLGTTIEDHLLTHELLTK